MKIILKNNNTTDSMEQWIFWVWIQFCPKPNYFYGFFFLKSYPPNNSAQPTLLGWIWWVWPNRLSLSNLCTPLMWVQKLILN
jgi:hypothetical protein